MPGLNALSVGPRASPSCGVPRVQAVSLRGGVVPAVCRVWVSSLGLSGGLGAAAGRPWCSLLAGYLVDPASSHMLVSKIKPCMSKYKRLYCETANGSLNQLWFI